MPCKMNENFGNFHCDPYQIMAVKFKRFFELNLSVQTEFHFILSHLWSLWRQSFALHEYHRYLVFTIVFSFCAIGLFQIHLSNEMKINQNWKRLKCFICFILFFSWQAVLPIVLTFGGRNEGCDGQSCDSFYITIAPTL